MVNSNTSFGNLKEVIVGRELGFQNRIKETTFKQFYKESLNESIYSPEENYCINSDLIKTRNDQLDNLATILTQKGIIVHRPEIIKNIKKIKTPTFETELSSASNVRDRTLVYKNVIVETPTYVRNRYFENMALYDIFNKVTEYNTNDSIWINAPLTKLTDNTVDLEPWDDTRQFTSFNKRLYDMAIDGAQFLKIGKDIIVNVSTYNHYLGYLWVKRFFPDSDFHMIKIADNHIDGAIVNLKPGLFLVDHKYRDIKKQLPQKFQKWDFIYPTEYRPNTKMDNRLASTRGMDINILSINENTVVVNKDAVGVIDILYKHKYNIILVQLDLGEMFGGGIHCSTLDLVREDSYEYYS